jgi:hypothetical protein
MISPVSAVIGVQPPSGPPLAEMGLDGSDLNAPWGFAIGAVLLIMLLLPLLLFRARK